MKKVLKFIGKTLLVILLLIVLFILGMTVYNLIMTKKEAPLLEQNFGQLVEVDGNNMNIYSAGDGDHTVVFMAGWGTPSPIYDFRPLYDKLTDSCQVAVIEKFGYGFSDEKAGERSFDTILSNDREALKKAGIEAPYILCPHSLSGLEAILWAQKYPDEVEGIIGLDITLPDSIDWDSQGWLVDVSMGLSKFEGVTGLFRIIPDDQSAWCTKEEMKTVMAITRRALTSETILREFDGVFDAFDEIKSAPYPKTPTIQYISKPNQSSELWMNAHQAVVDSSDNGKLVLLDCSHYVHHYESERISEDIKQFISELGK
ncbi:MAG: alpha/beta hydrolase [Ruminococcus sp.]|nr:alpha/beta hydrolase [Ruminococcus sp.]